MAKHRAATFKPEMKVRERTPKLEKEGGKPLLLCPFCEPAHPLSLDVESPCGTRLHLTAVQTIVPTRTINRYKLVCVKCHKGGGQMVRFHQGYVHLHECTPHTKLLAEPPEFSRLARMVFGLPAFLRGPLERYSGQAQQVKEVDQYGAETGRVLGYFFYKKTGDRHAETTTLD